MVVDNAVNEPPGDVVASPTEVSPGPTVPSPATDDVPLILSVGRLVSKKGFTDLVRACDLLNRRGVPFRCRIIGEGPERPRLEAMIEELSRLESETDELAERLQRKFFQREAELGIGTVFWYHMIRWIDQMANYADRVGSRLRLLIAR